MPDEGGLAASGALDLAVAEFAVVAPAVFSSGLIYRAFAGRGPEQPGTTLAFSGPPAGHAGRAVLSCAIQRR